MHEGSPERQDSMEHYRGYNDSFVQYPFRYFCRRCIRNFDTKVRVKVCTKCQKEDIVELPTNVINVPLSRLKKGEESKWGFLNKKLSDLRKQPDEKQEKKENFNDFKQKISKAFERMKENMNKQGSDKKEPKEKKEFKLPKLFKKKDEEELPSYAYE